MAMENPFEGKEVWFGVGSQDLYGLSLIHI